MLHTLDQWMLQNPFAVLILGTLPALWWCWRVWPALRRERPLSAISGFRGVEGQRLDLVRRDLIAVRQKLGEPRAWGTDAL